MATTSPIAMWSRNDLRARWRSLLILGLLAGLTAGLAVSAFDGARRTGSALARLERANNASDAVVFASQSGLQVPDWSVLKTRPEVAKVARWSLAFGLVDGVDSVLFAPSDGVFLQQVDRPRVVAGRMFNPASTDEMVVTDEQGDSSGAAPKIGVGDTVHFDAYGSFDPQAPPGPSVDFHVVGIIHSSLSYEFTGGGFITPGFLDAYAGKVVTAENAMVQLRNGAADMAALRRHASSDVAPGVPVLDFKVTARRVTATTDVEQAILTLLGTIVALTGLVFVGQAVARSASAIGSDATTLRALGMTRRQLTKAALIPHALTAAAAVATALCTAIVASRWFPVGLAGHVDPDRGFRVNVILLAITFALLFALIIGGVVLAGWLAAGQSAQQTNARSSWFSRVGVLRPLTVGVGIRMALESGRRTGRETSRSAIVGAVAAVLGIVAIVTLNQGLTDSLRNPAVAGVAWDATIIPNTDDLSLDDGVNPALVDKIVAQPGLAGASTVGRLTVEIGDVGVPTFTVIDRGSGGHVDLVTLTGRSPRTDDEVTLGPSTARDLGVGIGDHVRLADGGDATVVGLGLFPPDVHAQFDEGAQLTNARWFRLLREATDGQVNDAADFAVVAIRFTARDNMAAQVAALGTALGGAVQFVTPAEVPFELSNLHNVRRLPNLLAAFLTMLGIVALGHGLFQSVRRRRKDFAVMRALGITRGGARIILAAHASVTALIGLAVGVPLGLIAGRAGWRAITDRVPLTFHPPLAATAILIVVPSAFLIANALAVLPGRRAARLDPALVLRAEYRPPMRDRRMVSLQAWSLCRPSWKLPPPRSRASCGWS